MARIVIYHRADFDGIFCREIAKRFMPDAELIGWDYGDPEPAKHITPEDEVFILDLSVPSLMDHPRLVWIDHHRTAIDKYPFDIPGYRIDGVAACRLAWQWFMFKKEGLDPSRLPTKEEFFHRTVSESWAVRLVGEYDVWDKRDGWADIFQHGLRSQEIDFQLLLWPSPDADVYVEKLLAAGEFVQHAKQKENESIIKSHGFTVRFEGLTFLACNAARYNSHLFTAGLRPEHDGCLGFGWNGKRWKVSLYGVPGKPDVDLSAIAVRYGGGGHKQACGFECISLPFFF